MINLSQPDRRIYDQPDIEAGFGGFDTSPRRSPNQTHPNCLSTPMDHHLGNYVAPTGTITS